VSFGLNAVDARRRCRSTLYGSTPPGLCIALHSIIDGRGFCVLAVFAFLLLSRIFDFSFLLLVIQFNIVEMSCRVLSV
jgi:hypothetical protein